jgi:hypothetical protein
MNEKSSCPVLRERDGGNIILLLDEFSRANFSGAELSWTNLSKSYLNETNLENALSLKETNLCGAKGLTREQLEASKQKVLLLMKKISQQVHPSRQFYLPLHHKATMYKPYQLHQFKKVTQLLIQVKTPLLPLSKAKARRLNLLHLLR